MTALVNVLHNLLLQFADLRPQIPGQTCKIIVLLSQLFHFILQSVLPLDLPLPTTLRSEPVAEFLALVFDLLLLVQVDGVHVEMLHGVPLYTQRR